MRPLIHLADRDDAFPVFHALVAPALRAAARGPLRRARHAGRACTAPVGTGWCPECEATADDLLLESYRRMRSALTGPIPTTRTGEPVRELVLIRDHLTSADARDEDAAAWTLHLREAGSDTEPAWLRAARAQLVHYPVRHLEERTRRADAVRRGASARPDRDLRQAAWAAPLREDPAALDMLIAVVFRIRRRVGDPFHVPDDLRERHGLTREEAAGRLRTAMTALRALNPGFFAANIGEPPTGHETEPVTDQHDPLTTAYAREEARLTIIRVVRAVTEDSPTRAVRRRICQDVIVAICAVGHGRPGDPVAVAERGLGLTPDRAKRLVRRLATLVATAGIDWTTTTKSKPSAPARSRP